VHGGLLGARCGVRKEQCEEETRADDFAERPYTYSYTDEQGIEYEYAYEYVYGRSVEESHRASTRR
jgi:hypothetical protein